MNFILSELQNALSGVCEAVLEYPAVGAGLTRTAPVVALGVKGVQMSGVGEMEYLGVKNLGGAVREVYGFSADLRLSADIYVPRELAASGCREIAFDIAAALMVKLPSGLRVTGMSYGEIEFDQSLLMYILPSTLTAGAYVLVSPDDEGEFLDYELKGVTVSV